MVEAFANIYGRLAYDLDDFEPGPGGLIPKDLHILQQKYVWTYERPLPNERAVRVRNELCNGPPFYVFFGDRLGRPHLPTWDYQLGPLPPWRRRPNQQTSGQSSAWAAGQSAGRAGQSAREDPTRSVIGRFARSNRRSS